MFLEIIDTEFNDKAIINTNKISYIHEPSNTIVIDGVHGKGNGIIHVDKISMEEIISRIDILRR